MHSDALYQRLHNSVEQAVADARDGDIALLMSHRSQALADAASLGGGGHWRPFRHGCPPGAPLHTLHRA
ncbi:MAG: hypothetical protein QGH25_21920 [Candidatus Latescibacteria bacterium]|nr:hypothetical protein [Candidatus Latescibacterota bacterium]